MTVLYQGQWLSWRSVALPACQAARQRARWEILLILMTAFTLIVISRFSWLICVVAVMTTSQNNPPPKLARSAIMLHEEVDMRTNVMIKSAAKQGI